MYFVFVYLSSKNDIWSTKRRTFQVLIKECKGWKQSKNASYGIINLAVLQYRSEERNTYTKTGDQYKL